MKHDLVVGQRVFVRYSYSYKTGKHYRDNSATVEKTWPDGYIIVRFDFGETALALAPFCRDIDPMEEVACSHDIA